MPVRIVGEIKQAWLRAWCAVLGGDTVPLVEYLI